MVTVRTSTLSHLASWHLALNHERLLNALFPSQTTFYCGLVRLMLGEITVSLNHLVAGTGGLFQLHDLFLNLVASKISLHGSNS